MMKKITTATWVIALGLSHHLALAANNDATLFEDSLWQMSPEELGQVRVTSIATGTATPIDKAAAVTTVITDDDMAAMGARDIEDVLETVPGLHIGRNPLTYTPKFNIRGITSTFSPQTLILINGIPIQSLYVGSPSLVWAGMPVKSIARIEVIRGPGSALYGADAFSGVINIITKSAKDISRNTAGVTAGSFDSYGGWMNLGSRGSTVDLALSLEYVQTKGFDENIDADSQTLLDAITGTQASLAPGPVNTGKRQIEMRFEAGTELWTWRVGYQGRSNVQTGAGVAQALSPSSEFSSDRINTDLNFHLDQLFRDFDLDVRTSYYYNDQQVETNNILFPAGSNTVYPLGTFPNEPLFPEGVIGNPEYREEQARFELDGKYNGIQDHLIRVGAGFFWGDLFEVTEQKNFGNTVLPNQTVLPLTPRPNGLEEVADTDEVFLPERDRTSHFLYVQDEWMFSPNWALTTGVRYDNYSDFGSSVNPRAALVWATTDTITTKLLYGSAFRAPTVTELFAISNPVALGNPDLKPEKIDSYELAFAYQPNLRLRYSANLFLYKIEDFISFVLDSASGAQQAQNAGTIEGRGVEFEVEFKPIDTLKLLANYAYQRARNKNDSTLVGETPNHQIYGRAEWSFTTDWLLSTQCNWVGSQARSRGDNRHKVEAYTTVDFTLRKLNVIESLDFSLSLKNAFNEKVKEPSPPPAYPFATAYIPDDLPMAGTSLYGELAYKF